MTDPTRFEDLRALARERCEGADPAHDYLHVCRVADLGRTLALAEGADVSVVVPAALLHELFNYPKNHPESHRSGEVCAERAAAALRERGYPAAQTERIAYAIRVHPFSLGVLPDTLEARVLQDADRLDAIGAVGVARCFATCATMGRPFYNPDDPLCRAREPDDKQWGVDHFFRKLLKIPDALHTATARALGRERAEAMRAFLTQFEREVRGSAG